MQKRIVIALKMAVMLSVLAGVSIAQTGGGATLVGTVKDATGSVVGQAKITVVNVETNFVTETTSGQDGSYYVPYLVPGNYRIRVTATGFKEYVREGLSMRSAEVPRIDINLELGAVTENVTVNASAALVDTENAVSAYVLPEAVLQETPGVMKRTLYLMQYMPGVVAVLGQAGFHVMGQAQNDIGATIDGIASKSPYTGTVNQVDGVVQASTDAMEEVKVLTTGVSAEYGHTAGGSMKMIYKSGTNQLHVSFEDRFLPGSWSHRAYLTQTPNPPQAPWYYETFDLVASGPLVIPKIYNGRNKTFWLSDYAINHEHTINYTLGTVPTPEMLTGDFSFKDAAGGGLPLYNPYSTRSNGSGGFTRDPLPGNMVPQSLMDPIAAKFIGLKIWNAPNLPGTPSRTGPSNNLQFVNSCRCLHRDRWDEKIDHQFSPTEKIFGRYSQYHNRGQNGDNFAQPAFNASREINPTDDINGVISFSSILSRTMFNEFRVGYNRRASSNPDRPDIKNSVTLPGVTPETFPYFNIGYGIAPLNYTRQVGEDRILQDNFTIIAGKHSIKIGYEMIRTLYSDTGTALPSGQYNFSGMTTLPGAAGNTTGNDFAAFLMGAVSSASFTKQAAIWLPRQWDHEAYVQDDWKVLPTLSLNLGLRWTYFSPYETKYNQQSQFDPNALDPVTGRLGAITHPKGSIGKKDLNNFQPRLGLAWNFNSKWVFRSSFGIMTVDSNTSAGQGGFDEYSATVNINQATGAVPNPVFRLQDGPGPVNFVINSNGTVPYTGANFSSRSASYRDPNLRNAYIMNWSSGFQYQFKPNWMLSATYQGTAGIGLQRQWNINQIPTALALGTDRALQDSIVSAGTQQNYLVYPQFGTINYLSNFNHNTWHSGNFAVEKRYANGLTLNATFNVSKSLSNDDSLNYYLRAGKARTAYDQERAFGAYITYDLPVGRGHSLLNKGRVANAIFGGWRVNLSENALSGIPVSVSYSGSPNRSLLTGITRVNAMTTVEQAYVENWTIGNRFPAPGGQNPYYNMSSFAYPAAYTIGSLGARVLDAPAILWMQFYVTKSWMPKGERLKLSVRFDGHNLPWKRPQLSAPNTTYNVNSPLNWGRFTGTIGDFSNFGTAQANMQMSFRAEF